MGEETENRLLRMVETLVTEGRMHVTTEHMEAFEKRIEGRFKGVEQRLDGQVQRDEGISGRVSALEAAAAVELARAEAGKGNQIFGWRDLPEEDGGGAVVTFKVSKKVKGILGTVVVVLATALAVWVAHLVGVPLPT